MASSDTSVSIGAAFENLEVESDREKVKKKRDAAFYVKDKQGRRRFHGAFTGGFSAGYYNTVGTEEGWAPSQFVSSRVEKANLNSRKPEDFMDEEDLEEYGIAPRQVATKDEFLLSEKKAPKRPAPSFLEDSLRSLIVPARTTIGAQLLHMMGWKEGQGVGPRVPKKNDVDDDVASSSAATDQRVYSCAPHPQPMDKYEEMMQKFLFAPDDVGEWSFTAKGDLHGLGYSGIDSKTDGSTSEDQTMSLYGMSGQAFGVGALEEEDDDIYEVEKKRDYDRNLMEAGVGEGQFGWTGPHALGDQWNMKCFVKACKPPKSAKKYRCPPLPRNYRPFHKFINLSAVVEGSSVASSNRKRLLNASTRGHMLGEEVSVFNLISPEDKRRIERAKQEGAEDREKNATKHPQNRGSRWDQTPQLTTVRLPEWTKPGYKPFADDPAKQARYEDFLSGKQETCSGPQYLGMTEWEKQRERTEFARAADVYQPLATSLESKFTRGENAESDKKKQGDDTISRQTLEWHPHKILCRRFDVPEPYPQSTLVGLAVPTRKSKTFAGKGAKLSFVSATQPATEQPLAIGYRPSPSSEARLETGQGVVDAAVSDDGDTKQSDEEKEPNEVVRPSIDLFKSIFTESSASELSEVEDSEEDNKTPKITSTTKDGPGSKDRDSFSQQKLSNVKSQQSTTETKALPKVTTEAKLSWIGVANTVKSPEQGTVPPVVSRISHQLPPVVSRISHQQAPGLAASQYGPHIPTDIKGDSDGSDVAQPDKKRHKKKHKKHVKEHKNHKRKHKHS